MDPGSDKYTGRMGHGQEPTLKWQIGSPDGLSSLSVAEKLVDWMSLNFV